MLQPLCGVQIWALDLIKRSLWNDFAEDFCMRQAVYRDTEETEWLGAGMLDHRSSWTHWWHTGQRQLWLAFLWEAEPTTLHTGLEYVNMPTASPSTSLGRGRGWAIVHSWLLVRAPGTHFLLTFVVHSAWTLLRSVSNHICFCCLWSITTFFILVTVYCCVFYVLLLFVQCWPRLSVNTFCIDWLNMALLQYSRQLWNIVSPVTSGVWHLTCYWHELACYL